VTAQQKKAVILLSGGLDSATVLAMASSQGYACYALSMDYGQRHATELNAARAIAEDAAVERHEIISLDLRQFGGSALTDDSIDVPTELSEDIPVTYVPARNTIFLSLALAFAETLDAHDIFVGVNAVDYSGYPDCRPEYIQAFESMANLATKAGVEGNGFRINAPLIRMTKAEIIQTGTVLGVDYSKTVSCYQADESGAACGECDSCRLRRLGFEQAGVADPTRYR
jgi:7-cyano-7-deazaguanine synthase